MKTKPVEGNNESDPKKLVQENVNKIKSLFFSNCN